MIINDGPYSIILITYDSDSLIVPFKSYVNIIKIKEVVKEKSVIVKD